MTDIVALRKARGLTQTGLAKLASMDVRTLRRIEKEENISSEMVGRVMTALGCRNVSGPDVAGPDRETLDHAVAHVGSVHLYGINSVLSMISAMVVTQIPAYAIVLLFARPDLLTAWPGIVLLVLFVAGSLLGLGCIYGFRESYSIARPYCAVVLDGIRSGRLTLVDEHIIRVLSRLMGASALSEAANAPLADLVIVEASHDGR